MKFRYVKEPKLNYKGTQYHQGDILEMSKFDNILPMDWFEIIETAERIEMLKKNKEVISNGNSKKPNENLGSKRR